MTSFELSEEAFRSSFGELLNSGDTLLLVADGGGLLTGYCLAFIHATLYANGPVVWVEEIMVRADDRRAGIGRDLMVSVERWAYDRGATLIALATRRAADFYKALGYEDSATYFRKIIP